MSAEEIEQNEALGRDLIAMNDLYKKVAAERDRYKSALVRIHAVSAAAEGSWRSTVEGVYAIADRALA